jgi:hypothetical protein
MLPGEVKGDAAFTAFQEKLATVVANARASGTKVSNDMAEPNCRCPLGCHPDSTGSHPPSPVAAREGWAEVLIEDLRSFIAGYGNQRDWWRRPCPYYELGIAYREMFP